MSMKVTATTTERAEDPENPPKERWKPHQHNVSERYWVRLRKLFEEKGYVLRPRFREGWVASWLGTDTYNGYFEDGQVHWSPSLIDAVRTSDGEHVMFKAVSRNYFPLEVGISQYLASEALASDARNHSVPIYEVFPVPEELQWQLPDENGEDIMVMPRLRKYDSPQFDTIGEVVDFFSQIFEGLQFLHAHNIAHRDCNSNNIMMDAKPLYPDSWHPEEIDRSFDFKGKAKHHYRTARPVKYYFIDFGLSRRYKLEELPPKEDIIFGGDKSPPEHHIPGVTACNPFPTDVYYIGNLIREEFITAKIGFDFMQSLVDDMTTGNPAKRPTMDEVVSRFATIVKSLSSRKLRSRVVRRKDPGVVVLYRLVPHLIRRIRYTITRTPAIPSATAK